MSCIKHEISGVAPVKKTLTKFVSLICLFSAFTVAHVSANQAPTSFNQCIACHGDKAQGNAGLNAPTLAGQSSDYLARQLINFKTGLRGSHEKDSFGKQMIAFSQSLDQDKDIPALAQYIASLPASAMEQKTQGDLKNGSRYYQGKCGACHGGQAQGNDSFKAPKLSGQDVNYLKRQMQNFVSGVRGSHADDKLGRQMAMMAKTTSGKELDDILHYIAVQK